MSGQYNLRNPAVKRLMKEAQELREPTEQYYAQPLEDNLFEWHFTIRGPIDSEFDGGIYHGRITLPPEYPMKPPSIMLLTPNGRFETFKKICLSISGHHPESWQPSWSIRTALLAIIGFMPTHGNGAIGSLDYTPEERKVLAKRSLEWKCPECGSIKTILKPVTEASKKTTEEAKELATQINFQGEKEKNGASKDSSETKSPASAGAESAASAGPPSSTPEASGAAGSVGPPPSAPQTPSFPPFGQAMFPPNFPPGMPNAAMPRFMPPQMMTPPNTPTTGAATTMPPFPRPFWPGMMPGMPGNSGMPARPPGMMYPWPPMFNPMMMNPQMMAMMAQQARAMNPSAMRSSSIFASSSSTSTTPAATSSASSSAPTSSSTQPETSSTARAATTSTPTTSSSSSSTQSTSSSSNQNSTETPQQATNSSQSTQPVSGSSSNSTTASESPSTSTPTSSSTQTQGTTSDGLRQRTGAAVRTTPPAAAPTFGTAELPAQTVRRGENPVVVMVMALLGLLIIALILRRLYNVVNAGAFDNDF